jgi:Fur family zinc uptake transcriptional regulator
MAMSVEKLCFFEAQLDAATKVCARNGAQLTELRRHVLGLVLQAEGSSTAYQLLDRLKETRQRAAPSTIYRALDFLMEQRLIHKVERLNAFIPCTEASHHHLHPVQFLICRQCGSVVEIEDRAVSEALEHAAEREGFHPGHAMVELDGTCAACSHPA